MPPLVALLGQPRVDDRIVHKFYSDVVLCVVTLAHCPDFVCEFVDPPSLPSPGREHFTAFDTPATLFRRSTAATAVTTTTMTTVPSTSDRLALLQSFAALSRRLAPEVRLTCLLSLLSTVGRGAATADDGTAGPAADGDRQRSVDRGVGKGSASRRDDKRSPGDRGVNGGDSGSNSSCSSSSSSGSSTTVSGRNGVSGESADGWLEAQCGLLLSDALAAPGGVHGLLEVTVGNSSDDSVTTAAASVAMLLAKVPIELLSPDEYVSAAMEPLCARVTSLALCDGVGVCVSTPSCLHV